MIQLHSEMPSKIKMAVFKIDIFISGGEVNYDIRRYCLSL